MRACKASVLPPGCTGPPGQRRVAVISSQSHCIEAVVADRHSLHVVSMPISKDTRRRTDTTSAAATADTADTADTSLEDPFAYNPSNPAAFACPVSATISSPLHGHCYETTRSIHCVATDGRDGNAAETVEQVYRVASVDGTGCGAVTRMQGTEVVAQWALLPPPSVAPRVDSMGGMGACVVLVPGRDGTAHTAVGEAGDSGGASSASSTAVVSVVTTCSVSLYDGDVAVATAHTVHAPTDCTVLPCDHSAVSGLSTSAPLVAVTEGEQVSVWDLARTNAPVTRQHVGFDSLCSIAVGDDGCLLTGGHERTVYSLNPRTWRLDGAWSGALKYGIGTVIPSVQHRGGIFAASLTDSELAWGACGKTASGGRSKGMSRIDSKARCQGDARWVGVARAARSDDLVALTASGTLYVYQHPFAESSSQ
eukprot:m.85124 g.85124  ORF g.85124 m.85124 type:complete len:423 (-) comp9620_c0_seq1:1477-2745(-)